MASIEFFPYLCIQNGINDKNITQPHKGNNKRSVLFKKQYAFFMNKIERRPLIK